MFVLVESKALAVINGNLRYRFMRKKDLDSSQELYLDEDEVRKLVINFLINKVDGNWDISTLKEHRLKESGPDIDIRGGKRHTERFIIECKEKSHAKSANSQNKENYWLVALGQLISRMKPARIIKTGKTKGRTSKGTRYGLGLYWQSAQTALRRIPKNVADVLHLYVFSVDERGFVKQFSPSMFGVKYSDDAFHQ